MPRPRHLAVVVATGFALLVTPALASAAVIPVTITEDITVDDDECSLFEAVVAADGNANGPGGCVATGTYGDDTIDLDGLEYLITDGTIRLEPESGTLTFDGDPGSTVIHRTGTASRIFSIDENAVVEIEGMILENGQIPGAGVAPLPGGDGADGDGGGCILSEGALTLQDSVVRDCQAGDGGTGAAGDPGDPGGGGGRGGAGGGILALAGSLTLDNTEVTGNEAGDGGNGGAGGSGMSGGVGGPGGTGGAGGGIAATATVDITGGTIADNGAGAGGAAGVGGDDNSDPGNGGQGGNGGTGGGVAVDGDLTMGGATVSTNTAGVGGVGGDGGQQAGVINVNGGDGGDGGNGGGLSTAVGDSQLDGVAIDDNQAGQGGEGGFSQASQDGDGGAGGAGGGWYAENLFPELIQSTVTGNTAGARGARASIAGENGGGPGGGIIAAFALLTVQRSTIAGNTAGGTGSNGDAGSGGGLSLFESGMDMNDSAVTGNQAGDSVGAAGDGGGIHAEGTAGSEVLISNSTIAENSAGSASGPEGVQGRGGGIMQADAGPDVYLQTSTVAGNDVPADSDGGGLYSVDLFSVLSTIIAANRAGTESFNCDGSFFDEGFNLTSDATCPVDTAGDPKLGPLANNGGLTETMGLNAGSAALDQIPEGAGEACAPADQRGIGRPVGSACDIGAFEGVLATGGPGPGPGPGPGAKAAFGSSTLVTLSLNAKTIKAKGPVAVSVTNGNEFAVTGTLSGRTTQAVAAQKKRKKKRISLKAKAFTVPASTRTTVRLALPRKLRRLLRTKKKLSLRITAAVTDPAGNSREVQRVLKPKLKKPKKKKKRKG